MQNWRLRAELIVDRPRIPPDFRCEKIDHDRWSVGRVIGTRMTVDFITKPIAQACRDWKGGVRVWGGLWWRFAATRLTAMELTTIVNRCHRFRGFVPEPESTHDFF